MSMLREAVNRVRSFFHKGSAMRSWRPRCGRILSLRLKRICNKA
jgi:hypothetical protein